MGSPEHLTGVLGFDPGRSAPDSGRFGFEPGGPPDAPATVLPQLPGRRVALDGPRRPGLPSGGELVRFVVKVLAAAWLAFVAGLAFWSVLPSVFGWHPELVLTGSMEPAIQPGDIVLVAKVSGAVPPGRIVLVADTDRATGTYLHRVMRYDEDGHAVTKGDANPTEDVQPVEQARMLAEARLLVPAIGLPAIWLREGAYVEFTVIALITWVAAVICLSDVIPPRRVPPPPRRAG